MSQVIITERVVKIYAETILRPLTQYLSHLEALAHIRARARYHEDLSGQLPVPFIGDIVGALGDPAGIAEQTNGWLLKLLEGSRGFEERLKKQSLKQTNHQQVEYLRVKKRMKYL